MVICTFYHFPSTTSIDCLYLFLLDQHVFFSFLLFLQFLLLPCKYTTTFSLSLSLSLSRRATRVALCYFEIKIPVDLQWLELFQLALVVPFVTYLAFIHVSMLIFHGLKSILIRKGDNLQLENNNNTIGTFARIFFSPFSLSLSS